MAAFRDTKPPTYSTRDMPLFSQLEQKGALEVCFDAHNMKDVSRESMVYFVLDIFASV